MESVVIGSFFGGVAALAAYLWWAEDRSFETENKGHIGANQQMKLTDSAMNARGDFGLASAESVAYLFCSAREIMKKAIKIVLWLFAAFSMIAIVVIGLEARRILNGYHDTIIIASGPFASRFPSLYPDSPEMKKEIEQWFLDAIPPGTSRDEARNILSKSFASDLTSGKKTVIDERGSTAGGSSTSVRIHFDLRGRVKSMEVAQHWAYL